MSAMGTTASATNSVVRRNKLRRMMPLYPCPRVNIPASKSRAANEPKFDALTVGRVEGPFGARVIASRESALAHRSNGGYLHESARDAQAGDQCGADQRRSLRRAERGSSGRICRLHIGTLHQHDRHTHEMFNAQAGRCE